MVIPDIILVQLPCVSDMLLREIISGDRLLYQQIAPILFILEKAADCRAAPFGFAMYALNAFVVQDGRYAV